MGSRLRFRRHSTVSILNVTAGAPVLFADQGQPYTGFTVGASGGTAPYVYSVHSGTLPTGITLNSSTGVVSGTPSAAGVSADIIIRVTDNSIPTPQYSDLAPFTLTVSAAPTGMNVANQVIYFGSLTAPGAGGYTIVANQPIASAVIDSGNTGTVFVTPIVNGILNIAPGKTLGAGPYTLGITATGTDATTDTAVLTVNIEATAGRSVSTATEFDTAVAAWTTGTNIYGRPGDYGTKTVSGKHFVGASYITKHTGQTTYPHFTKVTLASSEHIWCTYLDLGKYTTSTASPPAPTIGTFVLNVTTSCHIEDCNVHHLALERFGLQADVAGVTLPYQNTGSGIVTTGLNTNVYVKRNHIYDIWIGINFGLGQATGVVEIWDNYFSTYATSSTIARPLTTQTSMTIRRNFLTGWCVTLKNLPAQSHTDGLVFFQSNVEWANVEISQNIIATTDEGPYGCKFIFFGGAAVTLRDVKILDNVLLGGNVNGIVVQKGNGSGIVGTGNIIAGNTLNDMEPGLTSGLSPSIFKMDGPAGAVLKLYGNIIPVDLGATLFNGGTVIKGPNGTNTNVITGYNNSIAGMSMAEIFAGPVANMPPANRAEVLSQFAAKTGGPADLKNAGGIGSGHCVHPTTTLSPTGASQVDTDGSFWE